MHKELNGQAKRKPTNPSLSSEPVVLSMVIASHNTRDVLSDCLRSIYDNPPTEAYEVIVVDDASRDGSSEMVRENFPEVRLFVNETHRHYANSNNRALDVARGEYVAFLNSDILVMPEAFDRMLDFLRSRPDVGVVGCRLLNEDDTLQMSVKSFPNWEAALFGGRSFVARLFPNNPFTRRHLLQIGLDLTTPFEVENGYVSNAACIVPRKVLDKAGNLDARFFNHSDADHCKRIVDAGYKCYYLPTAVIKHLNHKGGSMANLVARFRHLKNFEVQSYLYYCKHVEKNPSPMRIIVALGLFAHFLASASAQVVKEVVGAAQALRTPRASSP